MIKTPHRPKFGEKFFFFFSGIIICTPFPILVNTLSEHFLLLDLPSFYALLIAVGIIGPFIEEFTKVYPLFYRHKETEKSLFVLAFYTGLGFGITELVIYILIYGAPILIRLPLALLHATNTTISSYGIAKGKPLRFFLIAVGLHFLNNLSTLYNIWIIGGVIAIIGSYILSLILYSKTTEKTINNSLA